MPLSIDLASSLDRICIENYWHCVGHQIEIRTHLAYRRVLIANHDLLIHNHGGSLFAVVNLCPHRGSRLLLESTGCAPLRCPYHGWSFQPSGTSIPRFDTFSSQPDPREASLKQWHLEQLGGFIFVSLSPVMSLDTQLGEYTCTMLQDIGESLGAFHGEQVITYQSNWKLAVENALEAYHVSSIHTNTLGKLNLTDGINSLWDWASLWQATSGNTLVTRLAGRLKKALKQTFEINGYNSLYLFPFAMLSSTEGLSFALQTYFPQFDPMAEMTNVSTRLFTPVVENISMKEALVAFYDSTAEMNRRIFEEDASICSQIPLSSWSCDPLTYSSSLEVKIDHFRSCCRKALESRQV